MPNKFLLSFLWPTFDTIIYIRGSYNQFNTGSFLWWRWWCHAESFADGPSPYIVWRPSHSECHQEEEEQEEGEGYFISFPVLVKFPENARSGEGAQTLLTFHSIPSRECDKLHLNCKLRGCNLSAQLSQSLSQWVKVSGISNSSSSVSWKKSVPEFINTSVVRWDNKWHETKTLQSPSKSLPCRQISIRKPFQFTFHFSDRFWWLLSRWRCGGEMDLLWVVALLRI